LPLSVSEMEWGTPVTARAHSRGHEVYYDDVVEVWRYRSADPAEERPCFLCHRPPTPAGHDACLGYIPGAISACCGHGVEDGYIVWQEGVDRGPEYHFTVDRILLGTAGWLLGRWR